MLSVILFVAVPFWGSAQRLVYKEKVPQIVVTSLILGDVPMKAAPAYIDFFILGSPQNDKQIAALQEIASQFKYEVNFILITKDDVDKVKEYFQEKDVNFTVYHDEEGETFKNFGVKFVPFAVLVDKKGNFIWQGKNTTINENIIYQVL